MNMKNSIICALLVTATLLTPFASAGSQAYNVGVGQLDGFNIAGSLTSPPMLDQDEGLAVIVDAVFNPLSERWVGDITCVVPAEDGVCTGTVSSDE